MLSLKMKMVSSLEKCFYNDSLESKKEKKNFIMFRNERLSFQVMFRADLTEENGDIRRWNPVRLGGALAKYASVRLVSNVLNMYPTYARNPGGEFITTEPGAYPDLLRPLVYPNAVSLPHAQTHALWVDIELPEGYAAGKYDISVSILHEKTNDLLGEVTGEVQVVDAELPRQELIHTEWFYTDCIANHYRVKAFSEKHWKLIESYLRTAVRNGINMILTPVFTPELDTYIGGERLTTQLVEIEQTEVGKYTFDFKKLHRWIDLCLDCGVEYFEIPHFFTQWGAKAAPKIVVKVNGRNKKLFGWHSDSMGEAYATFLSQFIPALLAEFKKRDLDKKCFFHVSDEPHLDQLEQYTRCKNLIGQYLEGYPIIDALSDFEFYKTGALEKPAPHTRGLGPFLDAKVPGLWTYYCGGGKGGVSDRSIAMPLSRTRALGVQLYYYNIEGFLHWGYNFYNTCHSFNTLDPIGYVDGSYFTPAGDCFLVYPGTDNTAWESLRLNALREAVDDIRALRLYEAKFGQDAARKLVLEGTDGELTFTHYPTDPDYILTLREKIAQAFM
ncbi:MAG: DUF4091 domain-containing protein [Clostridia bacterium]|nr:DUF4091 domain-containing protein [Clostridia bacterium]